MNTVILCDIDGTIADKGERNPFDWQRVDEDKPKHIIIELVRELALRYPIVFVSGRKEECRDKTVAWLKKYDLPIGELFMRGNDDNRPDYELKKEIFDTKIKKNYGVRFVLDDRDSAVKAWRELGLTCLQVAEGNF